MGKPEGVSRMWEHALHEENTFHSRSNLFLLSESILLLAFVRAAQDWQPLWIILFGLGGLALTGFWMRVNQAQLMDLDVHRSRLRLHLPEYDQLRESFERGEGGGGILPSSDGRNPSHESFAAVVPALFFGAWVIVALAALTS